MKSFIDKARKITEVVLLVTGFVAALSAALQAFSSEMAKHYGQKPVADETANN